MRWRKYLVEKIDLAQIELDLEESIQKSIDRLREKLKMGFYGGFFHHDAHSDLLLNIKGLRDTLRTMRFAISHEMPENMFALHETLKQKRHDLEKFLQELKNHEEHQILENIIKMNEEIILYLELLYDNQQWFEMEIVDQERALLLKEDLEKRAPRIESKQQYRRYNLRPHPDNFPLNRTP